MAANETTIAVSTRIGGQTNTVQSGFKLPAASTEEMLLLSTQQITEHLNNQGAGIFKTIDGLGVLPFFRVEDGTHCLFAGERRKKVGVTFGGAVENKEAPIIHQIATELEEESHGQFRFAKNDDGQFRRNEKGQFIILCKQRTVTKQEDGIFSYQETEKELVLKFKTISNHFVDNRKSGIDPKTNKPAGFNMSFLTVQCEIIGLTKEELSALATDKTPSALFWNTIYLKLNEFRPARDCKDWDAHWNGLEEKRNAAKEAIRALYFKLQQEHGELLIDPSTVYETANIEGALTRIFDNVSSIKDYFTVLDKKAGNYSESPASTIVTAAAAKALANAGGGSLVDTAGNVITDAHGVPAVEGFLGYAVKGLSFPQPYGNRFGKFAPPSSTSSLVPAPVQQAPAFRN